MKPSETKKAPKPRKGAPEIAKKAPKKLDAPVAPKSAPVTKRRKETKAKIDETLLPMKTGLRFVVLKYIRTLDIPAEKLEETIRLTLENLGEQADAFGRKLDSLYWFKEGCSVEIKNGKIFAKDPEGNILVSGLKIKVIKPKKTAKKAEDTVDLGFIHGAEVGVEGSDIELTVGRVTSEEAHGEAIPTQVEELREDEVTPIEDAEAETTSTLPAESAPAPAVSEVAEEAPAQFAQESTPLTPEFITLLTKTNAEFQRLRTEFDSYKSRFVKISDLVDLNLEVREHGDALAKLPDSQFKLPQVRLLRMRIACLETEIEQAISTFQQSTKKAGEVPSLIKGLETKVKTFSENADTWIKEVELITGTSHVPTEQEIQDALSKNVELLAKSDALRKTISDIEASPTFDGTLQPQINELKEQIAATSKSIEAPVGKLRAFLAVRSFSALTSATPPNVVRLKTVTAGNRRNMPVNVDDVLKGGSWTSKLSNWFKNFY